MSKTSFSIYYLMNFGYCILLPLFLDYGLWTTNYHNQVEYLAEFILTLTYMSFIYLAMPWHLVSYHLRMPITVITPIAAAIAYTQVMHLPWLSSFSWSSGFEPALCAFLAIYLMFQIGRIIQGYKYPEETIKLNFPLHNGSYYVAHGGSNSAINHHVKSEAQRYALDIVKLDKLGWRAGGVYPQELSKYRIFGETIYSPIDGTVTEAIDGLPDLIPPLTDNQNVFGNYVAIEHQGVKVLLAHLQNGSVKVKVGDPIEAGQLLGKVGNSGHTSEPHLHVHAQRSSNGTGIPMLFADKFLKRNSLVTPTEP